MIMEKCFKLNYQSLACVYIFLIRFSETHVKVLNLFNDLTNQLTLQKVFMLSNCDNTASFVGHCFICSLLCLSVFSIEDK